MPLPFIAGGALMPGPIPKRADQRRRRNKPAVPVTSAMAMETSIPAGDPDWHPIAAAFYASLTESGQSVYYQASDWAVARYVTEAMSRNLSAERFSAQLMQSVLSTMGALLVTEGDRRRLRLELTRISKAQVTDASITSIDEWQRKLAAPTDPGPAVKGSLDSAVTTAGPVASSGAVAPAPNGTVAVAPVISPTHQSNGVRE